MTWLDGKGINMGLDRAPIPSGMWMLRTGFCFGLWEGKYLKWTADCREPNNDGYGWYRPLTEDEEAVYRLGGREALLRELVRADGLPLEVR